VVNAWCGLVTRMDRRALDRFTRDLWRRFDETDLELLKFAIIGVDVPPRSRRGRRNGNA
jgi:hypothetical protein